MLTANEIRRQFIDFFCQKHAHEFVPSSSVVPHDDPTLLFTNAGMNQFKDVFLGTGKRPYRRAANTQKCIRAGGKHNDLDDVGRDTYHHTFFEMLGNWSFGDYFKREAIQWCWELLTQVWGIDKKRLHVTVFEGSPEEGVPRDDEAYEYWKSCTDIDPKQIHWGNKKDNFWEMGETGPCGPCTEVHYDRTPNFSGGKLVNAGTPDVIEIWNLVFIQFNRNADRSLVTLPAKHVDTGMGFERITAVLQGQASNYDTDIFTPLFQAIREVTGAPAYTGHLENLVDIAYRVIADHIRTLSFAITDGAEPSNSKRGFVLRRILRRAERYGWQHLGTQGPFLHKLVPAVVDLMGEAFPELRSKQAHVTQVIQAEEESFLRTLDRGLKLFEDAASKARKAGDALIRGEDAFKLHDTYGVYIDITEQMALEAGLKVDLKGYEQFMDEARAKARDAQKKHLVSAVTGDLPPTDDSFRYQGPELAAQVLGWVIGHDVVRTGALAAGDEEVAILVDRTNFYAEAGGQVGDAGTITTSTGRFAVEDTQRLGQSVLHFGRLVEGRLEVSQEAQLRIDPERQAIMRNHTATHLLNLALRDVLGDHVEQKGSLVDAEKTRFDFTHAQPLSVEEIRRIERHVNERIQADFPVRAIEMPLAEAKKLPGVRAVFGEKYPDPVRVVMIGAEKPEALSRGNAVEFCGGTHLGRTSQAGVFLVTGQESVAKGVRRLTGVTGQPALDLYQRQAAILAELTGKLNCGVEDLPARLDALVEQNHKLQQQLKKGMASDLVSIADRLFSEAVEQKGAKLIAGEVPAAPIDAIRSQIDRLRQKAGSSVIVLGWHDEGKVGLLVAVTDDLVKRGLHAGKIVGEAVKVVDGKGGGNPTLAQAGGKTPEKLPQAIAKARELALAAL